MHCNYFSEAQIDMAESSNVIMLTEDDIPGAKLSELLERHTNQALRWWLLCRGIQVPVSLTKAKLIERFVSLYNGVKA